MRVVIQRVSKAVLSIDGKEYSSIGYGMVVLLGIETDDLEEDIEWLCGKIARLRIFDDENGVMNRSIAQSAGEIMVVSQFTLHASTKKGNRPSYVKAARPETAIPLYEKFINQMSAELNGTKILTGVFGAMMQIMLINDGPVTIIIDSKNKE
jgi:D-aminoacyl-tRNA deacylase